jgi:hypothetical protein
MRSVRQRPHDQGPAPRRCCLRVLSRERTGLATAMRGLRAAQAAQPPPAGRHAPVPDLRTQDVAAVQSLRPPAPGQRAQPGRTGLRDVLLEYPATLRNLRDHCADHEACRRRPAGHLPPMPTAPDERVQPVRPDPQRASHTGWRGSLPLPQLYPPLGPRLRRLRAHATDQDVLADRAGLQHLLPPPPREPDGLRVMRAAAHHRRTHC